MTGSESREGLLCKGIGGFYYVDTGEAVYSCRARGIFKKEGIVPVVGDRVTLTEIREEEKEAVVSGILPRTNQFARPPVANIDCMVIVMALRNPSPNFGVLDRFLVTAEESGAEIVICLNKADLPAEETLREAEAVYGPWYPLIPVSAATGRGVEMLKERIRGKKAALAGPSGTGKSSLLNRMVPGLALETGHVSRKTKRGKHTTRHVEIFRTDFGALLFDTPGFTSFDVSEMETARLDECYPEFLAHRGDCRYDDCRHLNEPDCAVRRGLEEGRIHPSRYSSYKAQQEELLNRKKY